MAESDKDRPQITLSSNSDELISPLDIRSIGPLATPPRRSIPISAPVSRSVPNLGGAADTIFESLPKPSDNKISAETLSILAASAATGRTAYEAAQRDLRVDIERVAEQADQKLAESQIQSAGPKIERKFWSYIDKAVLSLFEVLALLFALPFGDALFHDKPVTNLYVLYLVIGCLFAIGGPMFPLTRTVTWIPKGVAPSISAAARDARVWIVVLLLFFLYGVAPDIYERATKPNSVPTGFTQVQVNEKIAAATDPLKSQIVALRANLEEVTKQRDSTQHQILPKQEALPTPSGPIVWDYALGTWTTGDAAGTVFLGISISGPTNALVELTSAYIVSEITGERIVLQISTGPGPQLAALSEINQIPPKVRVELWAKFDPAIHGPDLLANWGRFRFHAEYSGVTYEKVFDQDYMQAFVSQFPGSNVGPHVTRKSPPK